MTIHQQNPYFCAESKGYVYLNYLQPLPGNPFFLRQKLKSNHQHQQVDTVGRVFFFSTLKRNPERNLYGTWMQYRDCCNLATNQQLTILDVKIPVLIWRSESRFGPTFLRGTAVADPDEHRKVSSDHH